MWNVDTDLLVVNDIPVHFKRMGDLFAYHALTAVRSHLGPDATKGKIRKEIERRISELSEEEYEIWRGNHEKLMNGDTDMLERTTADRSLNNNHPTPILRAPLRTSEVKKRSREGRDGKYKRLHDNVEKDAMASDCPRAPYQVHVKEEFRAEVDRPSKVSRHAVENLSDDVAPIVAASTDRSTERASAVSQPHFPVDVRH
jgi:hypothetical protein